MKKALIIFCAIGIFNIQIQAADENTIVPSIKQGIAPDKAYKNMTPNEKKQARNEYEKQRRAKWTAEQKQAEKDRLKVWRTKWTAERKQARNAYLQKWRVNRRDTQMQPQAGSKEKEIRRKYTQKRAAARSEEKKQALILNRDQKKTIRTIPETNRPESEIAPPYENTQIISGDLSPELLLDALHLLQAESSSIQIHRGLNELQAFLEKHVNNELADEPNLDIFDSMDVDQQEVTSPSAAIKNIREARQEQLNRARAQGRANQVAANRKLLSTNNQ